jgi:hypothetical protein
LCFSLILQTGQVWSFSRHSLHTKWPLVHWKMGTGNEKFDFQIIFFTSDVICRVGNSDNYSTILRTILELSKFGFKYLKCGQRCRNSDSQTH